MICVVADTGTDNSRPPAALRTPGTDANGCRKPDRPAAWPPARNRSVTSPRGLASGGCSPSVTTGGIAASRPYRVSAGDCADRDPVRERLVLREKSHGPRRGDSQDQDRDSHGRQTWRLLLTLTGTELAGQLAILLVSGSRIFPDTEEVTSSNLVPPTRSTRSRPCLARWERPAQFGGEPFGSRAGSSGPWLHAAAGARTSASAGAVEQVAAEQPLMFCPLA